MDDSKMRIAEILRINRFAGPLPLHPELAFARHEADAELVPLGDGRYLAVTMDVLAEEMEAGLYKEPETMGWILVQANLSDLAAVGATPIGLVLGINLGPEWDDPSMVRHPWRRFERYPGHLTGRMCHRCGRTSAHRSKGPFTG